MKRIAAEEWTRDRQDRIVSYRVTYDDGTTETTYPLKPENWRDRLMLAVTKWLDKATTVRPQCPWTSAYGRRCEYRPGHGGQCMTVGPDKRYRFWYGINYDMVEGLPMPKGQTH